jgi:hypothetical protein
MGFNDPVPGPDDPREADRAAALELLIAQEQRLSEQFIGRQSSADVRSAAAFAAAAGVVTLSLTAINSIGHLSAQLTRWAVTVLASVTAFAILIRTFGGYTHVRRGKPATESRRSREARHRLTDYPSRAEGQPDDPDRLPVYDLTKLSSHDVRLLALHLWRSRAKDAREAAIQREKLSVFAAGFLIAALGACVLAVFLVQPT